MSCPHSVINAPICPSSQSSLRVDLDSCLTWLHCITLLGAGPHLWLKTVPGVGEGECGAKNLPGLVPHNPDSPLTQKVVPLVTAWQVRGEVVGDTPPLGQGRAVRGITGAPAIRHTHTSPYLYSQYLYSYTSQNMYSEYTLYGSYVRCSPHHGSQNDKLNLYY